MVLGGGAVGAYFVYRAVSGSVSGVIGGAQMNCPTAEDISSLVGSEVTGPTRANVIVASGCNYSAKGPDDMLDVIITSGSKIITDEEVASFESECRAANAEVRSIGVGDRGHAWASQHKGAAIAAGDHSLVTVEVQGKNFADIPDKSDAAIAILARVLD